MIRIQTCLTRRLLTPSLIIGSATLALAGGCSQNAVVEPLDLRDIHIARVHARAPLRIVLGVSDFEGSFSEKFRASQAPLPTEERKRWRDMGIEVFPSRIAGYLQKRGTTLDARRDHLEAADLLLSGILTEFRRDWTYDQATIPLLYIPLNAHKWTVTSRIDARFMLSAPTGQTLTTFNVNMAIPPQVFRRTGLGFSQTGMPSDVEEEYGKTSREFLSKILARVEQELTAARGAFSYLERPDLETAQNLSEELLTGKPRNQWAVVIGISRYEHGARRFPDLQFADRDAIEFCSFLVSPAGGGFRKDHILLLTNADATYSAIRNGLFTFLKGAEEDDLVIIFFSGHGAPDPARPENFFLLPCDVDPSNIAPTAFPMWDMETVLLKIIDAQRVVVFADACHSAGVALGLGVKGVGTEAVQETVYNRYCRRLAHTRPGRVTFSSSGGHEQSLESSKWDGHGVFTWALLRALYGEADGFIPGTEKDGIVSLQEVIKFVEHHVAKETKNKQHPFLAASPKYDVDLPLGIVASQVSQ